MADMARTSSETTLPAEHYSTPINSVGRPDMPANSDRRGSRERESPLADEKPPQNGTSSDDGESAQKEPPKPVGFWDSSLNEIRKNVIFLWARTTFILFVFILMVLALYWAVLFKVPENMERLSVVVVDFDGRIAPYEHVEPLVGPFIQRMTNKQNISPMPHLGFINRGAAYFNNDALAVRRYVYDEGAWAAMLINANATALLRSAVETGNTSYSPLGACQIIYNQARDETVYSNYIIPMLQEMETEILTSFGEMWSKQVLQNTSLPRATLARVSQAVNPGIGFSTFNLRPFEPPVTTPAVTIGLIYLIIIAFFSFTFFLPVHSKFTIPIGHPPLKFRQLIAWRWIATVVAYLFLSLGYSLVSLAFQIPFNSPPAPHDMVVTPANAYGKGTFPVYWMLNFVGMCALGIACENVAMVIGMPWTSMWLIFWVITNVCTSFYNITLSPRFFYWGYAWPLHHIVGGSRTLLFDTKSHIGENFGILFAWTAVNSVLFPFCCVFMRWKTEAGNAEEQGKPKPKLSAIFRKP